MTERQFFIGRLSILHAIILFINSWPQHDPIVYADPYTGRDVSLLMRKNRMVIALITLLLFNTFYLNGQIEASASIEFQNTSVLFKEGGQKFQKIIASFQADEEGSILITRDGLELLKTNLKKGGNRFLITVPAVSQKENITISARINEMPAKEYSVTLVPPKRWEVFIVQHSHTDIGYTRPQSEILAEHLRFIDYALDYCDQTDAFPDAAKFRWTCESAWVTQEYLKTRPASQIERLLKRIEDGRMEVTAMLFNMSEIADENIMFDFLQPLKLFREYEIPAYTAMQNDVNGVAWCIPDYLKATGVKYLNMGINETRSIRPFDKPTCFW